MFGFKVAAYDLVRLPGLLAMDKSVQMKPELAPGDPGRMPRLAFRTHVALDLAVSHCGIALPSTGFLVFIIPPVQGTHRVNYLPPFEGIKELVNFAAGKGELTVNYTGFVVLIRTLLQGIDVDEA
jgi:hypothetical protein